MTDTDIGASSQASTRRRWLLPAVLAALAAGGVAVGLVVAGGPEERTCHRSGPAEVCLVGDGPAWDLEGSGFRPGSEVTLADESGAPGAGTTTGEGGEPWVVRAGAHGRIPDGAGKLGILGGDRPQRYVVTGTAADGTSASVEVPVPAVAP